MYKIVFAAALVLGGFMLFVVLSTQEKTPNASETKNNVRATQVDKTADNQILDAKIRALNARITRMERAEVERVASNAQHEDIDNEMETRPVVEQLTPEEAAIAAIEAHEKIIETHDEQSRDANWAVENESILTSNLTSSLTQLGLEHLDFTEPDCRTSSCLVRISGNYTEISENLGNIALHGALSKCHFNWSAPPPEDEAANYEGIIRFHCDS